jgi:hypothetical protein
VFIRGCFFPFRIAPSGRATDKEVFCCSGANRTALNHWKQPLMNADEHG